MNEEKLDQILDEIRKEEVSPEELSEVQNRVWEKLAVPTYCQDFRTQLPAYAANQLGEQSRLLLTRQSQNYCELRDLKFDTIFSDLKGCYQFLKSFYKPNFK